MSDANEPAFTHKATVTFTSDGINDDVAIKIEWSPDLDGQDITKIGYLPASYQFVQQYVLPMIEDAFMEGTEQVQPIGQRN